MQNMQHTKSPKTSGMAPASSATRKATASPLLLAVCTNVQEGR